MAPVRDPYDLLGLDRSADDREVKRAYRRLAKRYHPDAAGDPRLFVALRGAYETLMDPQKRQEWDRRHPGSGRGGAAQRGNPVARAAAAAATRENGRPRDRFGRFVRPDAIPWWEEIRGAPSVGSELPGSRGDPHLGPSSSGAAWSSAARAYHRRLTRQESGSH